MPIASCLARLPVARHRRARAGAEHPVALRDRVRHRLCAGADGASRSTRRSAQPRQPPRPDPVSGRFCPASSSSGAIDQGQIVELITRVPSLVRALRISSGSSSAAQEHVPAGRHRCAIWSAPRPAGGDLDRRSGAGMITSSFAILNIVSLVVVTPIVRSSCCATGTPWSRRSIHLPRQSLRRFAARPDRQRHAGQVHPRPGARLFDSGSLLRHRVDRRRPAIGAGAWAVDWCAGDHPDPWLGDRPLWRSVSRRYRTAAGQQSWW